LGITIRADCNKQLARAYIDTGCIRVQIPWDYFPLARNPGATREWLPIGLTFTVAD